MFDAGTLDYVATLGDPGGLGGAMTMRISTRRTASPMTRIATRSWSPIPAIAGSNSHDGSSFAYLSTIGTVLVDLLADDNHLNQPFDLVYDLGRDQILVADTANNWVQAFGAGNHAYAGTIGTTTSAAPTMPISTALAGIANTGPGGDIIIVADYGNDRIQIFSKAVPSVLAAALLPGARSVQQIGSSGVATVFATLLNRAKARPRLGQLHDCPDRPDLEWWQCPGAADARLPDDDRSGDQCADRLAQ